MAVSKWPKNSPLSFHEGFVHNISIPSLLIDNAKTASTGQRSFCSIGAKKKVVLGCTDVLTQQASVKISTLAALDPVVNLSIVDDGIG